ncbi:MAG: polyprenyl synthetase family protein, partial [Arenibacterium sp.]
INRMLPRIGPHLGAALLCEIDRVAQETAEGQAVELGWRFDNAADVTCNDYLEMVLKKTCWLAAILPCRVGATLGARRKLEMSRFVRFGFFAGTAFQIKDDLMNIEHHAKYGKELCGDIHEGKRTLMLIDLLQGMSARDRRRLLRFLSLPREDRTEKDVAWIRMRMVKDGSMDRALMVAKAMVGAASTEFEKAFSDVPNSRDKAFIRSIPAWMLNRSH